MNIFPLCLSYQDECYNFIIGCIVLAYYPFRLIFLFLPWHWEGNSSEPERKFGVSEEHDVLSRVGLNEILVLIKYELYGFDFLYLK